MSEEISTTLEEDIKALLVANGAPFNSTPLNGFTCIDFPGHVSAFIAAANDAGIIPATDVARSTTLA